MSVVLEKLSPRPPSPFSVASREYHEVLRLDADTIHNKHFNTSLEDALLSGICREDASIALVDLSSLAAGLRIKSG